MRAVGVPWRLRAVGLAPVVRPWFGWLASFALVAAVTGAIALLEGHVPVLSLAVIYLFAVLPVAVVWGLAYAVAVSVASMLAFNFFFLPPLHTLTLADTRNWLALLVFVATAVVVSELAARSRRQARESALLAQVAAALLERGDVTAELERIGSEVARALGAASARISLGGTPPGPSAEHRPLVAGGRVIGSIALDQPGRFRVGSRLLPALASLLAVAVDRERLAHEALETETLRRSDAVKTAILRAVSHDLRTPLMAILTSASALRRRDLALDAADRDQLLETLVDESRRLDRLVVNLLDLSRLQAGAAEPDRELVPVDELLVESLEAVGAVGNRVEISLPRESPTVQVDRHQVQRVLVNLIENALKFSPAAEPVRVRVAATSAEVLVRVIDRGPGIAADEAERIFAPFQRGARTDGVRGAGLGLAIAIGFAEANGGRLALESHPGQGATLVLVFPVVTLNEPETVTTSPEVAG